ncbi:MAG: NAD-dependent epimerase/dehydratase family protein [Verrucomicrobiota bacterium]|nr:NAD-dependent epimerase/dehydratase family protein [Verrucomicrobiota bacterium]
MRIVITGGAGFIGSSLAKFHLERGDSVIAFDSLISGGKQSLATISEHPHFCLVEQDICRPTPELREAIASADRVYHMAAILGQHVVLRDPIGTLSQNIASCETVLRIMDEEKSKARLAIASSSAVYFGELFATEEALLTIPSGEWKQQPYRLSKIINEVMALSYVHEKGIFCVIPRLSNITGIGQNTPKGIIMPHWIKKAIKGEPLQVYGTGQQLRTFCNVRDIVQGLHLLLETDRANGEIVNLGSEEEISLIDLARKIKALCNSHSRIELIPYKQAYGIEYTEIMRARPNLAKLEKLTGFRPAVKLEETLKEMVDSYAL